MFGKLFARDRDSLVFHHGWHRKGSQPVKAYLGFISKTYIPIPLQKASIPKIRINGSWMSIS